QNEDLVRVTNSNFNNKSINANSTKDIEEQGKQQMNTFKTFKNKGK
ncbi:9535_t:CDS:1, partial [Gigaspora margarita]